jgi:uncharacterized protein (TIGR02246 family)
MFNEEAVLEVNQRFYNAINGQDIEFMKKVWHDDVLSICVHPGWPVMHGYPAILQSWRDIFQSTDHLEIQIADIRVLASLDLAWVSCEEKIVSLSMSGVNATKAYATNVYRLVNEQWKITLHHASLLTELSPEDDLSRR